MFFFSKYAFIQLTISSIRPDDQHLFSGLFFSLHALSVLRAVPEKKISRYRFVNILLFRVNSIVWMTINIPTNDQFNLEQFYNRVHKVLLYEQPSYLIIIFVSIPGQIDLLDAVRIEAVSKRTNGVCAGRDDNRAFQITGGEEFTADFQTVFPGNTTHVPGIK